MNVGNKKVKILHIGLDKKLGGIESFLFNLYNVIDRDKYDFEFVSYDKEYALRDNFIAIGAKVFTMPDLKNPFAYFTFWYGLLKHGKYEIVHFHKNSAANIIPIITAKALNISRIFIHSHNTNPSISNPILLLLHYINRPLINMIATCRLACSESAGYWLFGKRLVKDGYVTIIHNGIEMDRFAFNQQKRNEVRKELMLQDCFVIGNVGRFSPQKNHTFLVDIFAECVKVAPRSRLLLVGEGALIEQIKKKVKSLKLENKVIFTGVRNDVDKLYQAMDVFVMPSLYEGFAIVRVEALCSGVSAVMSAVMSNEPVSSYENSILIGLDSPVNEWVDIIMKEAVETSSNLDIRTTRGKMLSKTFSSKVMAEKLALEYETR